MVVYAGRARHPYISGRCLEEGVLRFEAAESLRLIDLGERLYAGLSVDFAPWLAARFKPCSRPAEQRSAAQRITLSSLHWMGEWVVVVWHRQAGRRVATGAWGGRRAEG